MNEQTISSSLRRSSLMRYVLPIFVAAVLIAASVLMVDGVIRRVTPDLPSATEIAGAAGETFAAAVDDTGEMLRFERSESTEVLSYARGEMDALSTLSVAWRINYIDAVKRWEGGLLNCMGETITHTGAGFATLVVQPSDSYHLAVDGFTLQVVLPSPEHLMTAELIRGKTSNDDRNLCARAGQAIGDTTKADSLLAELDAIATELGRVDRELYERAMCQAEANVRGLLLAGLQLFEERADVEVLFDYSEPDLIGPSLPRPARDCERLLAMTYQLPVAEASAEQLERLESRLAALGLDSDTFRSSALPATRVTEPVTFIGRR